MTLAEEPKTDIEEILSFYKERFDSVNGHNFGYESNLHLKNPSIGDDFRNEIKPREEKDKALLNSFSRLVRLSEDGSYEHEVDPGSMGSDVLENGFKYEVIHRISSPSTGALVGIYVPIEHTTNGSRFSIDEPNFEFPKGKGLSLKKSVEITEDLGEDPVKIQAQLFDRLSGIALQI